MVYTVLVVHGHGHLYSIGIVLKNIINGSTRIVCDEHKSPIHSGLVHDVENYIQGSNLVK
jgi:hypothetical protein